MKLYTRRGDEGRSRINGPGDLHKSEEIFEALGAVDEANSFLGLARQTCKDAALKDDVIPDIQARLLDVGSALSTPCGDARRDARCRLRMFEDVIRRMEEWIDGADARTPPLTNFVLPGGNGESASRFHVCRTVARRAERRVAAIAREGAWRSWRCLS
eukprot:jgi/Mesvir1/20743/Mv06383-RA.1